MTTLHPSVAWLAGWTCLGVAVNPPAEFYAALDARFGNNVCGGQDDAGLAWRDDDRREYVLVFRVKGATPLVLGCK